MATRARLRVLVVEDDPDVAEVVCLLFRSRGHRVESASSGRQALETARRFHPEVVICDIGLPDGQDGFGVAQAFRADPEVRGARLIAFTAYSGLDRQAREAGFERYLQKPGDVSRLLSVVENAGL